MNLGISTACFYPLETELAFQKLGEAGVGTAELFFNASAELKPAFLDLLLAMQKHYGIKVASIHPTMSLAESFMIFSHYDRRYREAEESYRRYSEIAAALGAKYIIMHGGKPNGILSDEEYCERYMRLKEATLENGVTVLQENVVRFRAGDVEFLRALRELLGNDAEFCIDLKQALRCGLDPMELTREFLPNIKHFHISDHSVASDCLLPGDGGFNFLSFFELLRENRYTGAAVIEVYQDCYQSYKQIFEAYKKLKLAID